jgi:hypothetical protein
LPSKAAGVAGKANARIRFVDGSLTGIEGFVLSFGGNLLEAKASRSPRQGWTTLSARAVCGAERAGEQGRASLDVTPGGSFTLGSPDLGALLSSLGYGYGQRGALSVRGKVALNQQGVPFDARVVLNDFVVRDIPLMTRLVTLASLRGMLGALTNEGIRFDRSTVGMSYQSGVLTLTDGVARSSSLTLTVNGTIDVSTNQTQVRGRVIPSYFGINQGVGKIPLIGRFLTGNEGGAVQAIDYTATGTLGDPQVKVDALSSLTPQALQDLWRRFEW